MLVLDLLNCPSLHILIGTPSAVVYSLPIIYSVGVVNKMITEIEKNVFSSYEQGKIWMENFLNRVY